MKKWKGWKIEVVEKDSLEYPAFLKEIPQPPLLLFRMGRSLEEYGKKIAIVGTRKASENGLKTAREWASVAAGAGLGVVSGLAFGIDSAAHRGCLDGGGFTIAVLGSGIDNICPPGQSGLAEEILRKGGSIISEYPAGAPAYKGNFLRRNRIIAGLCEATLVVEAPFKSGAINTATQAFDQNRQVFAMPGDINKWQNKGCNLLIKQNKAELVSEIDDILKFYNLENSAKENINLSIEEKIIWKIIATELLETSEIIKKAKLDYAEATMALTNLEISRLIRKDEKNCWKIN
jgi:DNA processing protein